MPDWVLYVVALAVIGGWDLYKRDKLEAELRRERRRREVAEEVVSVLSEAFELEWIQNQYRVSEIERAKRKAWGRDAKPN